MRFLKLIAIALILWLGFVWACPFYFPIALFAYSRHPDLPRTKFVDGQLGLIQPEFDVHYLVVAYRHLSGAGLNWAEKEQVLDYWRDIQTARIEGFEVDWPQRWDDVVRKYPDVQSESKAEIGAGAYLPATNNYAINCAEDAFRTAQRTWQARSRQFGAKSKIVRDWVQAQVQVFNFCSATLADAPAPLPSTAPLIARQDRDYQIAAAAFYGFQFDKANAAFRRIAADSASPWSRLAPYLAVRNLIREGTMTGKKERFAEALAEARRILQSPRLAEVHGITKQALHRAGVAYGSDEFVVDLARTLTRPGLDRSLRQDLYAFQRLYDRDREAKRARNAELIDWLYSLQTRQAAHTLRRWQQQPDSLPWLAAALIASRAPANPELLAAAKGLPPQSPAFLTAQYHRERLLIEAGEKEQARQEIDVLLATPLPKSAANELRVLRAMAAPDLNEYLRFSFAAPLAAWDPILSSPKQFGDTWDSETVRRGGPFGTPLWVDPLAKGWNESTPLKIWIEAIDSDAIPRRQRLPFLRTALVRTVLLKRPNDRDRVVTAILAHSPKEPYLSMYSAQESDLARDFTAVMHILFHADARPSIEGGLPVSVTPGQIDMYFGNWWCAAQLSPARYNHIDEVTFSARPDIPHGASFLSADAQAEGTAEWSQLKQAGGVLRALKPIVMEYARANPRDPRSPEALWRLLRAGRYALCYDGDKPIDVLRLLERIAPGSEAVQLGRSHYVF